METSLRRSPGKATSSSVIALSNKVPSFLLVRDTNKVMIDKLSIKPGHDGRTIVDDVKERLEKNDHDLYCKVDHHHDVMVMSDDYGVC